MPHHFSLLDWLIVALYFALLAASGWWFSRREPSGAREYFLAGRQMPVWAVAISVVATATSAATFIGAPEEAFAGNLTYLSTNIGAFIAVAVVAIFFIPAFYRHNVTTVYDLLEVRFGRPAKMGASWAFLIGRILASGARLFIGAIPLALILFRDDHPAAVIASIAILVVVGILYTLVGGIRSVIWTDAIQTLVFVVAVAAAAAILLSRIPVPLGQIISELRATQVGEGSKLVAVTTGLDPAKPLLGFDPAQAYTLLTAVCGFSLLMIAAYGTDHDLAQRMLTCKTPFKGSMSAVTAIIINLPIVALFMCIGLLLYVFYQRPDLMGAAAPHDAPTAGRKVFLTFILTEMPSGLSGLMMAGLFATGLGSFNSALNAMAAAFVNDCYTPLRPGKSERHYLVAGRFAVAGWGIILGAFACFCVFWQEGSGDTLIQFALNVMTFAYAGLLGVYFTALFTKRRGNSRSALAALAVGFVVVGLMQKQVWPHWAAVIPLHITLADGTKTASLADIKIAFPWILFIATACTTTVCLLGTTRPRRAPG
ncbi:MAG: sodium:solute symporter [Phycisphaerales bacterium]